VIARFAKRAGPRRPRRGARTDEVAATREAIGLAPSPVRGCARHVYEGWDARKRGAALEQAWNDQVHRLRDAHPSSRVSFGAEWRGSYQRLGVHCRALLEKSPPRPSRSPRARPRRTRSRPSPHPADWSDGGDSARPLRVESHPVSGSKAVAAKREELPFLGVREFGMSAAMNAWR